MLKRLMNLILIGLVYLFSLPSHGVLKLDSYYWPQSSPGAVDHSFVLPNERHPYDAIKIFKNAPTGAYISLGSERGFIGASLTPAATQLITIDRDPQVVVYNQINIALLKIAAHHQDYLWLRLQATQIQWREIAEHSPLITKKEFEVLSQPDSFRFFRKSVTATNLIPFRDGALPSHRWTQDFKNANYLTDESLFEKLSNLAKTGQMLALLIDINDVAAVKNFFHQLKEKNIIISILDISNVWEKYFTSSLNLRHFLHRANVVTKNDSLLLLTKRSSEGRFSHGWTYHAIHLKNIIYYDFHSLLEKLDFFNSGKVMRHPRCAPLL